MKKSCLDKRFTHHKWFLEGVTVRYALDYFARTGFYLEKKLKRKRNKREANLFATTADYDDVLRSCDYRDRSTYRVNEEEKEYFLEQVQYWKEETERKNEEWLSTEVDLDQALKRLVSSNSYYNVKYAEYQRDVWKNKHKDEEMVKVWEGYIEQTKQSKAMIDDLIEKHKHTLKTNADFKEFEKILETEVYDKFPA